MIITVKKEDIPKNEIIELSKNPKVLVVFDGKNYYAFNGICTHAQWPLDKGNLKRNILNSIEEILKLIFNLIMSL